MQKPRVIGISGVAGSGKDLFFTLLKKYLEETYGIHCNKLSLADELKKEVNRFTIQEYGIDALTCSREDKELIRPLLVFHGTIRRGKSLGRHWINILNKKIKKLKFSNNEISIITDIRYDQYENDEVYWLKNELSGTLVHISNYAEVNSGSTSPPVIVDKNPANDAEKANDPKLKQKSDYSIRWPYIEGTPEEVSKKLTDDYIIPFAKKYLDSQK